MSLAVRDVLRIKSRLEAGQRQISALDLDTASTKGGLSIAAESAAASLDAADSLARTSTWLDAFDHVPLLGSQIDGLRDMTGATVELGNLARGASGRIDAALDAASGNPAGRVTLLDVTLDELTTIDASLATLHPARGRALLPPLSGARDHLAAKLAEARTKLADAKRSATALRRFLAGPTRVLIFAATNAEMTAGSGMPNSGGVATIDQGDINLADFVTSDKTVLVGKTTPTISPDLHALYDSVGIAYDFRGMTSSPNFPAMAPIMQQMARQVPAYGAVDAVVVVDPFVVRDLLGAAGPVVVDGTTYTADTVVKAVLNDNYLRFGDINTDRSARTELQGAIARAAFDAVKSRGVPLTELVKRFAEDAKGRHLLAWSGDPELQRVFHDIGADGALPPDSMTVSEINVGGNKLDWYLQPKLDMTVSRTVDDTFLVAMTLTIRNDKRDPTTQQIEGLVPDRQFILADLHLPVNALDPAALDGSFEASGLDPPAVVRTFRAQIPTGTTGSWRFTFRLPTDQLTLRIMPSARVHPTAITVNGAAMDDSVQRDLFLPLLAPPTRHRPLDRVVAAGLFVALIGFGFALSALVGRKGAPALAIDAPARARYDATAATWLLSAGALIVAIQVLWSVR
ncbi:MAG: DUF4012 domain-containing protein [Acidimicrobiales bacterium]